MLSYTTPKSTVWSLSLTLYKNNNKSEDFITNDINIENLDSPMLKMMMYSQWSKMNDEMERIAIVEECNQRIRSVIYTIYYLPWWA